MITAAPGTPLSMWLEGVRAVLKEAKSSPWKLGDSFTDGTSEFGLTHKQIAKEFDLSHGHVRNLASVATRVPVSRRRDKLSWAHHSEVAGLSPDGQNEWLDRASEGGWSKMKLRKQLIAHRVIKRSGKLHDCAICGRPRASDDPCFFCKRLAEDRRSDPKGTIVFAWSDPIRAARELMNADAVTDTYLRRFVAEVKRRLDRHEEAIQRLGDIEQPGCREVTVQ